MSSARNDYGLWGLVVLNSIVFVGFAYSFTLLSKSWHVLYHAQRRHQLARAGPYRYVRHPQYIGLVAIMFGFLLQWPTLLTLAMFPVLVAMYIRLASSEERDSEQAFGQAWRDYAAVTPKFFPRFVRHGRARAVGSR